jgi:hypothetical protein
MRREPNPEMHREPDRVLSREPDRVLPREPDRVLSREPDRVLSREPDRDVRPFEPAPPSLVEQRPIRPVAGALPAAPVPSAAEGTKLVSSHGDQPERAVEPADNGDDDAVTSPLPVILPGMTTVPRPGPVEAPRGPFEPARPTLTAPELPSPAALPERHVSVTGSVPPPPTASAAVVRPPTRQMPEAAAKKLDQIKDLYLTAEAIGEDALGKHFEQVSQRQRELIKEFFQQTEPEGPAAAGP